MQGHSTDLQIIQATGDLGDYLINFVNHLDPNVGAPLTHWPQYTTADRQLLTLLDGDVLRTVTTDSYRKAPIAFLAGLARKYPLCGCTTANGE